MRVVRRVMGVVVCATCLALSSDCAPGTGPDPGSSPGASPSAGASAGGECPECPGHGGRWAVVVLYEERGTCKHQAGPPRAGACRGEEVTWRIYNRCSKDTTVRMTDFRFSAEDPGIPPAEEDPYKAAPGRDRQAKNDPFEAGDRQRAVRAGAAADLKLKVRADAAIGYYSYVTELGIAPDADQQIEIWR